MNVNSVSKFIKKAIYYIIARIYVNETLILFEHVVWTDQRSPSEIRNASYDNLPDILHFQAPKYLEVFQQFLKLGDKGYFAYLDGKCVHRSWVKFNKQVVYLHPLLKMRLKENEAFIHYCETAPDARGMNIYPHVLCKIVSDFGEDYKVLICVNSKNKASIRGVKKAGFTEIRRIKLLIIFGVRIYGSKNLN